MQLAIADSAFDDLKDIQSGYREQALEHVGDQLISEIIARLEVLAELPEIGRIVPEFAKLKIRELIHPLLRIVYWLDSCTINVVWGSERLLRFPNLNHGGFRKKVADTRNDNLNLIRLKLSPLFGEAI